MEELDEIEDEEQRFRRLVELNVAEQCINLYKTSAVQQSRIATGMPRIHGFVYELSDGLIKPLPLDLHGYLRKYRQIYELYA